MYTIVRYSMWTFEIVFWGKTLLVTCPVGESWWRGEMIWVLYLYRPEDSVRYDTIRYDERKSKGRRLMARRQRF